MRPSQYNIALRTLDTDRYFIFNSRTQAVVELPKPIAESVRTGECLGLPRLLLSSLRQQGFLVDADRDEADSVVSDILKRRLHKDVRLILIPTYHCNLRCPYCYEGQVTRAETPDLDGWPDKVSEFLSDQLDKPETRGATIGFFGGEPLLAAKECLAVVKKASSLLSQRKQLFYCTLTTNGSIVNASVEKLLKYVQSVQVTLDGVGEDHDLWRCYANKQGTYETILKFIALCENAGVARTAIRLHFHDLSEEHLRKCAGELKKAVGDYRSVYVYFSCPKHGCYQQGMKCSHDEDWSLDVEETIENARRIFFAEGWKPDHIVHADAMGPRAIKVDVSCSMIGRNAFIVDGHGEIYFCPVAVRNPHMRLGRLEPPKATFEPLHCDLTERWTMPSQCSRCKALPFCQSGCYAKAAVNHEDIRQPYCELDRIDHLIRKACAMQNDLSTESIEMLDHLGPC